MEAREIIEKMEKEDRLLSESAVMKAVQKALIEMGYEPLDDRVIGVYKAIENTPTANDWIPCSERLPEENDNGKRFLVVDEYDVMAVCIWSYQEKYFVVAWDGTEFTDAVKWKSIH